MKFRYLPSWITIAALSLTTQIFFSVSAFGQRINEANSFRGYYYDYKIANPAFVAFEDLHRVTAMYNGLPFSSDQDQGHLNLSYEAKLDKIKSGIGVLFTERKFGPESQRALSLFYRYKFDLTPKSDIRVGTQISYNRVKIDWSYYRPIHPDDPLIKTGEDKSLFPNVDIGLTYHSPWVTIGGSIKNILEQEIITSLDSSGKSDYSSINFIATRKFKLSEAFTVTPSIFYLSDSRADQIDINFSLEIKKWIIIGGGYQYYMGEYSTDGNITLNAGLNIKDYGQFVLHVYSSAHESERDFYSGKNTYLEAMLRFRVADTTSEQ